MPRPSIVIGIGGTGSWVLSWLKKDLLQVYGDLKKRPIRLLLIDTADLSTPVGVGAAPAQQANRQEYSNYIVIENNEFLRIPTGSDERTINLQTQQLRDALLGEDAGVENINAWMTDPRIFPPAAWRLFDGAGQWRQMGRLALFQGMHFNGSSDPLYTKLSQLITEVQQHSPGVGELDVHVVGSWVGGTGSGIFMDIAWLLRHISHNNVFVSGFFVLPRAWGHNPTREQYAKSFAAWRELNRLMTVEEGFTSFSSRWGNFDDLVFDVKQAPYDHVYLVDNGLGGKPEDNVFPIIAQAVNFFIDENAGETYVQHIRHNLSTLRAQAPRRGNPTYSALYVKAWKLPIYHSLRKARHEFMTEYLRRLLDVQSHQVPNPAGGDPLTEYHLVSDPNYRQRAVEIFESVIGTLGNTVFIEKQKEVCLYREDERLHRILEYANPYRFNLLEDYATLPQTETTLRNQIREVVAYQVPTLPNSRNPSALLARGRSIREELYGPSDMGGVYLDHFGEFQTQMHRGRLYGLLSGVHDLHMQVFRSRVREWIVARLNEGTTNNYSGLACVQDAIQQLLAFLNENLAFYTQTQRNLASINEAEQTARRAYEHFASRAQNRSILARLLGRARGAMRYWLGQEVYQLALKQQYRALDRITLTLQEMIEFVEKVAFANVIDMVNQLVSDNTFRGITGLYRAIQDSLEEEIRDFQYERAREQVVSIIDAPQSGVVVDGQELDEMVQRTRWTVDESLRLSIEIPVSPNPNDPPEQVSADTQDPSQTRRLVVQLVDEVARYYVRADERQTALNTINWKQIRDDMVGTTETTLHQPSAKRDTTQDIRTYYMGALGATNTYRDQTNDTLNDVNVPRQLPHEVAALELEDPHRILVFSARELLMPRDFAEWSIARQRYELMVHGQQGRFVEDDLRRVAAGHIFAAEQAALRMASRFYRNSPQGEFPLLNHRLVHLMEHEDKMYEFFRLWAAGWVLVDDVDGQRAWVIKDADGKLLAPLVSRVGQDTIQVIGRYATFGHNIYGQPLRYSVIENDLGLVLDGVIQNKTKTKALQKVYDFEIETAAVFAEIVQTEIRRQKDKLENLEDLRKNLEAATKKLDYPAAYAIEQNGKRQEFRPALAELFAYDLVNRREDGGAPLVADHEAHLQAMRVLVPLVFEDLKIGLENRTGDMYQR